MSKRVFKMPHPLVSPPPRPSKTGGERQDKKRLGARPSATGFQVQVMQEDDSKT